MPTHRSERSPRWLGRSIVAFGLSAAVPASAATLVLYEQENFRGASFVADQTIPNFGGLGFNDRASSVVIKSGTWQICTDAHFRGRCETLQPGEYPTLRSMRLENQVSSVREIGWQHTPSGPPSGPRPSAQVELFEQNGFAGRAFPVNGAVSHFPVEFNDRASSMVIHSGYWEACQDIHYRGGCQVYGPGRYANLGGMTNRISSVRPVAAPGPEGGGWGNHSRALLYEGPNFAGRMMVLGNEVANNLAVTGFNDRASSVRVEGGYWMFCSDVNFNGECLTLGPGDYATLPGGFNNRISSGRRIRENYPYSQNPNWQR